MRNGGGGGSVHIMFHSLLSAVREIVRMDSIYPSKSMYSDLLMGGVWGGGVVFHSQP